MIIDANAAIDGELLDAVPAHAEIVVLDARQNGVQQISAVLASRRDLQSVHVLSHGSSAELQLGNATLSSENLDQYAASIAAWGKSIGQGGDLLLYGCNVAEGQSGKEFIRRLATLTGVDVAASTDRTASTTMDIGNWELEWHQGEIDHSQLLAADVLNRFQGTLAISGADLNLNGSASILNGELQLTGTGTRQSGNRLP